MTMPRLSLYRPQKGNDYKFIDKNVWEMFQVGGTDVLVHRYIGPDTSNSDGSPSQPIYNNDDPLQIQDLLFLENRDRKYDPDVYVLRGVYNLQDIDFNLSQFGLFLQNDTVFMTFHINDTVEKLGRKIIAGDVIELPHLKDDHALNDLTYALKRFYVIEEVTRAAEGFSVTWYPHLYRAKCKPLVDSQEFKDILDGVANSDKDVGAYNDGVTYYPGDIVTGPDGKKYEVLQEVTGIAPPNTTYYKLADSLRDIVSTYEREMQITQAVLNQAEADAPKSGYDTANFWTLQRDQDGNASLVTVDNDTLSQFSADAETQATDADGILLYDYPAWSSTKKYQVGEIFAYSIISATSFKKDRSYTILSLGNTNWNLVANTSGVMYSAGDTVIVRSSQIENFGNGIAHEIYNDEATLFTVVKIIPDNVSPNPIPYNSEYYSVNDLAVKQYAGVNAASMLQTASGDGYDGYLTEDGIPPNGAPLTAGIAFPVNPVEGQYCLRNDYLPNRLFRFSHGRWHKQEDNVRMTMNNLGVSDVGTDQPYAGKDVRLTQKTSFINNTATANIDGHATKEKQSLSKALRPKADE
jgi:hypothetical protein